MRELYDDLEDLCEVTAREIGEANEKIRSAGGKVSPGDVEYLDKLTHMAKSIKTTMAMMDADGGSYGDGSYMRGGRRSYNDGAYARGRNARRDGMGRYSRRAYDDGMDDMERR